MATKKARPRKSSKAAVSAKRIISRGKKVINRNIKVAQAKGGELEKVAMKEYAKIKKQMDATAKKVENYVKKNPARAAAISAGIGMALGAVAGLVASSGKKANKKKK
jgi:ElaB/YqjD/DUF883 family membrane-anchored ribosome-binding protein